MKLFSFNAKIFYVYTVRAMSFETTATVATKKANSYSKVITCTFYTTSYVSSPSPRFSNSVWGYTLYSFVFKLAFMRLKCHKRSPDTRETVYEWLLGL